MLNPRSLIIAMLVAAVALVAAMPAAAAELRLTLQNDKREVIGDGLLRQNTGGGFTLIARDRKKDGSRITANAWTDQNAADITSATDANGANRAKTGTKGCAVHFIGLTGQRVFFQLCRQDANGNVDKSRREVCAQPRTMRVA